MSAFVLQALRRPPIGLRCVFQRYASTKNPNASKPESLASPPSSPAGSGPSKAKKVSSGSSTIPKSSCAPGTVLNGVNYLKGQEPVLARPDEEYPEWLWATLVPKVYEDDGPGGKLERVTRRNANRQTIKDRNFMQTQ